VQRFLNSIGDDPIIDVEVIVVDQNADDRVEQILKARPRSFTVRHERSAPGLSRARNVGLTHVSGDIVAFPDDDCWYEEGFLRRVVRLLNDHPEWHGVTGRSRAEDGGPSGGRFSESAGRLDLENVWSRGISYTIFVRREVIGIVGQFDESLGLGSGSPFGSGEETDFLIRAVRRGCRIEYIPDLVVIHPNATSGFDTAVCAKAYSYGLGMGRVLRKHGYSVRFVTWRVLRPLLGALLFVALFRFRPANYHANVALGRFRGWIKQYDGASKDDL
jgi:GT2 family glycosyltransferase